MNIVILHGWGHSADMWKPFASKFHGHKVLTLDLPGFGQEKQISPEWNISDYARWTARKLKTRGVSKAAFVGHSFGGKIATEIALNNPKLVSKLILIAAPVLRRPSLFTKTKILIHRITKKVILRNAINIFTNDEYRDAHENKMGKIFVNSVNYDATSKLQRISMPTLIVWGEDDKDAPLFIAREMNKLIKNSRLEILRKTGHNIYLENPNILFGIIKKFLDEKDN